MTMPNLKIEQTEDNLFDALGSAANSPFTKALAETVRTGKAQKVTVPGDEQAVAKVRQHIRQVGSKNGMSVRTKDHPSPDGKSTVIVFQATRKEDKNGNAAQSAPAQSSRK